MKMLISTALALALGMSLAGPSFAQSRANVAICPTHPVKTCANNGGARAWNAANCRPENCRDNAKVISASDKPKKNKRN